MKFFDIRVQLVLGFGGFLLAVLAREFNIAYLDIVGWIMFAIPLSIGVFWWFRTMINYVKKLF